MATECSHCGATLPENAEFCSGCGARVEKEEAPVFCRQCGAKFPENAGFCPACGAPRNVASSIPRAPYQKAAPVSVPDWLIWSIISTLAFFPIGVGALVFSLLARSAADRGELQKAIGYADAARIWNIVVLVFALLGVLFGGTIFLILFYIGLANIT